MNNLLVIPVQGRFNVFQEKLSAEPVKVSTASGNFWRTTTCPFTVDHSFKRKAAFPRATEQVWETHLPQWEPTVIQNVLK